MDRKSYHHRPRALISRPLQSTVIDKISQHCEVRVHPLDEAMPVEMLAQAIRDVDGLMCVGQRVGKDILEAAAELRVISNVGVGYDNIDVEACTRRSVLVTNTPDVLTQATADLAFSTTHVVVPLSGLKKSWLRNLWTVTLFCGSQIF